MPVGPVVNMGAGASAGLTDDQELRVAKRMLRECDKKLINQEAVEKDPALFTQLKSMYEKIIADVKTDIIIVPPNDEAHTGIMAKLATTDILFDSVTTLGLGDVVKAKAPGEEIAFEGVIIEHMVKRDGTEMVLVDFGENEVELCKATDCVKVLKGTTIEVGDKVQAKPLDEENFYEGIVTAVGHGAPPDFPPLFTVAYADCEDVDENLPEANVRKVESARVSLNRFRKAVNKVRILNKIATASSSFVARASMMQGTGAAGMAGMLAAVESRAEEQKDEPATEEAEGGPTAEEAEEAPPAEEAKE